MDWLKEGINQYMFNSIRRRLLSIMLLLAIVPLVFLSVAVSYISYDRLMNTTSAFAIESMERLFMEFEATFEEADTISSGIIENQDIQRLMHGSYETTQKRFSKDLEGGMELSTINLNRSDIMGIYVLGNNEGQYKSNIYSFKRESFLERTWYQDILKAKEPLWFFSNERSMVVNSRERNVITMGRPFTDKLTGEKNGAVIVEIDTSLIQDVAGSGGEHLNGFMLLDDIDGVLVASDSLNRNASLHDHVLDAVIERAGDSSTYETVSFQTNQAIIVCRTSEMTGWKLVGVVPMEEIRSATNVIIFLAIIISIVFVVINIAASYYLSRKFTTPIVEMEEKMMAVQEGDFSVRIEPRGNDEFAHLATNFNTMLGDITDLINEIHLRQEQAHKLEFRALQAQINPHFLYNSLDSIIWLLKMEEVDNAIVMLKNLTILFRISLSKGSDIIPLEKELQHIDSYLSIQSLRYSKKFDYSIQAPEDIQAYRTIKLVLQPLVENAIYHGISEEKPFVHIDIIAEETDEGMKLTVRDNGIGMDQANLEKLRATVYQAVSPISDGTEDSGGYGLHNINERIKVYFGEAYALSIESVEGQGTSVSMVVPKGFGL